MTSIVYVYDALGKKLRKTVLNEDNSKVSDYIGFFQYLNDELQFFPTSEGYVSVVKDNYNYVYNYTDHLGNVRVSYTKDPDTGSLKILEDNQYYPFGMKHQNYNSQKYEYKKQDDGSFNVIISPVDRLSYQYKYNNV
ncbi:MAG: hypothetical protein EOO46_22790 [Flavobacterium sp.]|nr:MAG: hypothetical protein EOO46_22790 [Flavobacterium sp.]